MGFWIVEKGKHIRPEIYGTHYGLLSRFIPFLGFRSFKTYEEAEKELPKIEKIHNCKFEIIETKE